MNRQQLTILLVLALVLGAMGLYIANRKAGGYQTSTTRMGQKVLPDFPMNDVAAIHIDDGTNQLNLVKKEGIWTVEERFGYPARFTDIGDLLRKIWDLKAVQTVEVGPSQYSRLELAEPGSGKASGTQVDFKGGDGKPIASVLLGKKHMRQSSQPSGFGDEGWPDGRYLRSLSDGGDVVLVSESFTEVEPEADRWLNKDFFKVEKIKSVTVEKPEATNSWTLFREMENGEVKLADAKEGETLDTSKASSTGNMLGYPSFNDVVSPEATKEETGMDEPITAKIETFEGFQYAVQVGKPATNDSYYISFFVTGDFPRERTPGEDEKPEDKERLDKEFNDKLAKLEEKLKKEKAFEPWTYLVSKWTVDPILRDRKDLLIQPKDEDEKTEVPPTPKPETSIAPPPSEELPPLPGFEVD